MDAREVVSDGQLLSDFIRRTRAVYESLGETLAWAERLEAESEPPFYEYEASAGFVHRHDTVRHNNVWRTVEGSCQCGVGGWHLTFVDDDVYPPFVCCAPDARFRVRRPRGERAA